MLPCLGHCKQCRNAVGCVYPLGSYFFFRCMPRSGIVGSQGSSIFSFSRSLRKMWGLSTGQTTHVLQQTNMGKKEEGLFQLERNIRDLTVKCNMWILFGSNFEQINCKTLRVLQLRPGRKSEVSWVSGDCSSLYCVMLAKLELYFHRSLSRSSCGLVEAKRGILTRLGRQRLSKVVMMPVGQRHRGIIGFQLVFLCPHPTLLPVHQLCWPLVVLIPSPDAWLWFTLTQAVTILQFSSVAQSCLTLCDPTDCSTPGLPVHRQLPEFTQTHVH